MTGMLATVAIVLMLTLVTLGAWMLQIPPGLTGFSVVTFPARPDFQFSLSRLRR